MQAYIKSSCHLNSLNCQYELSTINIGNVNKAFQAENLERLFQKTIFLCVIAVTIVLVCKNEIK